MSFCENLRQARRRAGLTQLQAARALGVTPSAYCGYETGKREPDLAKLLRLCRLLDTPCDALLGLPAAQLTAPQDADLSGEEAALLSSFRDLDAHGRRLLLLVAQEELRRVQSAAARLVPFRVSEQPAAAGLGVDLGADSFRDVRVRADLLPRGAAFGVPVRGDSMEPRYRDRDILVVSRDLPAPGEPGVFILDGAGFVKLLGHGELLSLNPAYSPIPMNESIRPVGKVVGLLREGDLIE